MIIPFPTRRRAVVLPALCWGRGRPDFYAVTVDLAPDGLRLRSSVVPALEEALACNIRHVGRLDVTVIRIEGRAFDVRVHGLGRGTRSGPGAVAKRLLFLAEQQRPAPEPTRVQPRLVPLRTAVAVTLDDGRSVPATILNLSASGVALSLGAAPEPGATITVGRTPARVARRFAAGIGAAFLVPLDPDTVSERAVL